jgi:uncharacterized SAM-dependent methyltransferase
MISHMNTLAISDSFEGTALLPQTSERLPARNEWYEGCEVGMAFCRLTEALSFQPGTKVEKELRSLEQALARSIPRFCRGKCVNLVDLGTGDGQKMILVLKALSKARAEWVRYIPVDTNPYIARYAIFTILGGGRTTWSHDEAEAVFGPPDGLEFNPAPVEAPISIESLVWLSRFRKTTSELFVRNNVSVPATGLEIDFFEDLTKVARIAKRLNGSAMNIFCLLGNTFGNYPRGKQHAFVEALFREMHPGDLFLLGVGLRPSGESASSEQINLLEKEYQPGESFMRLGADDPCSRFSSKYDCASHSMKHSFERPDGSVQEMGYSKLFDASEVILALANAGFEIANCESYPGACQSHGPRRNHREPQYLTVIARKAGEAEVHP